MWLAVFISSSHLRTLGLEAGESVQIFPLSASASSSGPSSIKSAKEASSICLLEIHSPEQVSLPKCPSYSQKQHRDWLNLAAREVLGTFELPCAVALTS